MITFINEFTYLHWFRRLAGVIDANFPVFTHRGQELSIWAPRHPKDLNVTQTRTEGEKGKEEES